MRRLHIDQLVAVPWKNGGGTTRELAVHPPAAGFDDFHWRVSIADVRESGAFSAFPGIDRIILLLDGDGMTLDVAGVAHPLTRAWTPLRFGGEDPVHATLKGGPSRDFNLMLRRDKVRGELAVWHTSSAMDCTPGASLLLFATAGQWSVSLPEGGRHALAAGQAITGTAEAAGVLAATPLDPGGALVVIHIVFLTGATHVC